MTRSLMGVRRGLGFVLVIALAISAGAAPVAAQSGQAATLAVLPLDNNSGDAAQAKKKKRDAAFVDRLAMNAGAVESEVIA